MYKRIFYKSSIVFFCIISVFFFCNKIQKKPGFTIVSLSPAVTEILFAIGAKDKIVGVTTYCDYPKEAKELYKVGDFSRPSLERIVGLKPDLVILNLPEQRKIKQTLERMGIATFVSSPKSLDDIYKEIAQIGAIVGRKNGADSLIEYMKAHIKAVDVRRKKRVYIELSVRPLVTIGSESFLNELLEMAGATNIFFDLTKSYSAVSQEIIIKRDPETILVLHPGAINERMGWGKITAIKKGKVFTNLNHDHLLRPGPRLVMGFEELVRIINE